MHHNEIFSVGCITTKYDQGGLCKCPAGTKIIGGLPQASRQARVGKPKGAASSPLKKTFGSRLNLETL